MKKKESLNYLEMIPEKLMQSEMNDDGKVVLLVPRFKSRIMKNWGLRMGRSEFIRVSLDDLGSRVWIAIDGTRTVEEIGKILESQSLETVSVDCCSESCECNANNHNVDNLVDNHTEPHKPLPQLYERLTQFMSGLLHHRFIEFKRI